MSLPTNVLEIVLIFLMNKIGSKFRVTIYIEKRLFYYHMGDVYRLFYGSSHKFSYHYVIHSYGFCAYNFDFNYMIAVTYQIVNNKSWTGNYTTTINW